MRGYRRALQPFFCLVDTALALPLAYSAPLAGLSPSHRRRPRWPMMSGREVRSAVVVGLLLIFGFLPCGSLPSVPTGGVRWSSSRPFVSFPWWRWRISSGSDGSSENKPGVGLLDLEVSSFFLLPSPSRRGGGRKGAEDLESCFRCPGVLEFTSNFSCLRDASLFVRLFHWSEPRMKFGSIAGDANNLLVESLIWRRASCIFSVPEAIEVVDSEQRRCGRLGLELISDGLLGTGACSAVDGRPPLTRRRIFRPKGSHPFSSRLESHWGGSSTVGR